MKILIAEDELFYRLLLVSTVRDWGYEPVPWTTAAPWERLCAVDAPKLAIIDWMMLGMDGRRSAQAFSCPVKPEPTYVIIADSPGWQTEYRHRAKGAGPTSSRSPSIARSYGPVPGRPEDRRPAKKSGGRVRLRPRRRSEEPIHPGARRASHRLRHGDGCVCRARRLREGDPSGRGLLHDVGKSVCPTPSSRSPAA